MPSISTETIESTSQAQSIPQEQQFTLPTLPPAGTPGPLFFDLETIPDYDRVERFGLDPLPTLPPETPITDMPDAVEFLKNSIADMPKKVSGLVPPAAWISGVHAAESVSPKPRKGVFDFLDSLKGLQATVENATIERRKLLSTTPEFCRIAAIGLSAGNGENHSILCRTVADEIEALATWWDFVDRIHGPVCGYNIIGFDLPVIMVRSAILGVTPTVRRLSNVKPWDRDVAIDLMLCRFGTTSRARKLKDLANIYGIKVDAEGVDGSQVEELFEKDPALLAQYVKSDVQLAKQFYRLWRGYFC